MKFPVYIAKRYLFSKSSNNAINIITAIAAVGVIVGAMSLFIVLSGFSGLKEFSLQFTNVFDSDLKVYPDQGKTLSLSPDDELRLAEIGGIAAHSKIIEERVFLQYKGKNHIAFIKGVDENFVEVNPVDSILFLSEWFKPGLNEVVIGTATALKLSLGVRDYGNLLEIYVPTAGTGQITELNLNKAFAKEQVVVSGLYEVNEDINDQYVFTDLELARNLLALDSTKYSSVELKLSPDADQETVRAQLTSIFPEGVVIKDRVQQNDALYKMLNTENIAVYLIFTLVLIIALFNVVGSIIMMILDKRGNIKTLYNLGATIKEIRRIFFYQGSLMTTLGGLVGIILGTLAVLAQIEFEFVQITSTLAYPVKLKLINVVLVFLTISILGILASKLASSRVSSKLLN